jgi:hypothetical protein
MQMAWHPEQDLTPTPSDVVAIAEVMEGRHGVHAEGIARFFADHHALAGDAGRSWAWAGIAEALKRRASDRDDDEE